MCKCTKSHSQKRINKFYCLRLFVVDYKVANVVLDIVYILVFQVS